MRNALFKYRAVRWLLASSMIFQLIYRPIVFVEQCLPLVFGRGWKETK